MLGVGSSIRHGQLYYGAFPSLPVFAMFTDGENYLCFIPPPPKKNITLILV
jgi:hypothetical protein